MPKYNFLGKDKKLNSANFIRIVSDLYEKSKRDTIETSDKIDDYYNNLETKNAKERLEYFVGISKEYISKESEDFILRNLRLSSVDVRNYVIDDLRKKLLKYCKNNSKRNELLTLLDNKNENRKLSIDALTKLVKDSVDDIHKDKFSDSKLSVIPNNVIIKHFDKYLDSLYTDISNRDDSNEIMEQLGVKMNNYIPLYDYSYDTPSLTNPKYENETNELINELKNDKSKELSNHEINESLKALDYANNLFGDPIINIESFENNKIELDNAVAYNHLSKASNALKERGFNTDIISLGRSTKYGYYNKIDAKDIDELHNLRDNTKIEFANDTKKGLLQIIDLIREAKLEKSYIVNDSDGKVYGFNRLRDLGNKYKDSITNSDKKESIKAIDYAKEIKELDNNISSILDKIGKVMPLDEDNLAFDNDLDLLNNQDIPAKYRMDYKRIAQLSSICSLINLIDKYKLDINKFLDDPMFYLRDLYQKEYLTNIDPNLKNKNTTGVDLIFNLSKKQDKELANEFLHDIPKLAMGLAYFENDKNLRMKNASTVHAMNEAIFKPYIFAYKYDAYNLNNSIDRLIINPNLTFNEAGLRYYDADKLSFINMEEKGFDEVEYIKRNSESYEEFKERFDENILKFMKLEADYIRSKNDVNSMYFGTAKYMELMSRALSKILIVKKEDENNPAYQELTKFLSNKKEYINNLIDSIPNNPKYSDYLEVKELKNKKLKINNEPYVINQLSRKSEFTNILNDYENFVSREKILDKNSLKDFINSEKKINSDLKKKYDAYIIASKNYQKEVEKIYGLDYKGDVNNLLNDDIKEAFRSYTDKKRLFTDAKNDYIKTIEAKSKSGQIPSSYYMDRLIQLEVDNYQKLPPLFSSDHLMNRDEYIKLRYPTEFDTLSEDEKNLLYDSYKYEIKEKENDFFSRKYLETNNLTNKKEALKLEKGETIDFDKVDYKLLENGFLNLEETYLKSLDYERPRDPFNELVHLRMRNDSISDFKKNLDERILNIIKKYDNAKDSNELNKLPKIDKVIDLGQRSALKYLLTISTYERSNPLAKELSDFLVDGKSYINNLISKENEKLLIDSNIKYDIKNAKIDELSINKYANSMNDFNDYFNKEILNTRLPIDLYYEEEDTIVILKGLDDYLKELKYEKYLAKNNIMHVPTEPAPIILSIDGVTKEEYLKQNIDERIEDCLESYDFIISNIQTILEYYYSHGEIPKEYVTERMRRLSEKDYSIPSKFMVDDLPGMDKFIKLKYPTLVNELTNDEKKDIYLNYIRECEEERRQFLLRNYFVEKGITENRIYDFNDIGIQRIGDKNIIERQKEVYEDIEKKFVIEANENEVELPKFDNVSEISNDDEINLNDILEIDVLDSVDPKNVVNEEMEYIRKNDHFTKWIDNLKDVIKEELGPEEYELQSIEEHFTYDPVKDSFNFWLADHLQALEMMFENNLNDVFSEVTNRLENDDKNIFVHEIVNLPEFRKYFEDEIQEFAFTPLYESPANDEYNLEGENDLFNNFVKQLKADLAEKEEELDEDSFELEEKKEIVVKS